MDLMENSKFDGPQLGYDPYYKSDYFSLTSDGCITRSDSEFVKNIFIYPNKELAEKIKVELYWNNRFVQTVENDGKEIVTYSADYWDNCCDEEYLEFINRIN